MWRLRQAVAATTVAAGVITVLVAALPSLHLAYRRPALHTALEEAATLVSVLATFLVAGRFRGRARLNELLLVCAFALLALASVLFVSLPAFGGSRREAVVWDGRAVSVLGALVLAAAALAPRRRLVRVGRDAALGAGGVLTAVTLTAALVWSLRGSLPGGPVGVVPSRSAAWPDLHAPAAVIVMHVLAALFYAVAVAGFLRRAERVGDEFLGWLAVASVLALFSRVNYVMFPTRYTNWVYSGDGFRLLFFVLLLAAALREISSYWRSVADAAVLEERRRIARDLHDGLAQELAYIGRNIRALPPLEGVDGERLDRLGRAVERAQLESRQALTALSTPVDEPLEVTLGRAVSEVADRFGAAVELDVASGLMMSGTRVEGVIRIACEAVGNAARHSGAQQVALRLERVGTGLRLEVRDRGCGFDPAAPTSGFGLVSMRERARSIGGRLMIESVPGTGTKVELAL